MFKIFLEEYMQCTSCYRNINLMLVDPFVNIYIVLKFHVNTYLIFRNTQGAPQKVKDVFAAIWAIFLSLNEQFFVRNMYVCSFVT